MFDELRFRCLNSSTALEAEDLRQVLLLLQTVVLVGGGIASASPLSLELGSMSC